MSTCVRLIAPPGVSLASVPPYLLMEPQDALVLLVFPVVHGSYGFGFLRCVLDLAVRSRRLASRATLPLSR